MDALNSRFALPASDRTIIDFLSGLSRARSRTLMLDYDGTLAPFCIDPEQATPYSPVLPLLYRIQQETDTRLVVLTGRQANSLAGLLGISGIEIWGYHGLERIKSDGTIDSAELEPDSSKAIAQAADLLFDEGLEKYTERKRGAIAIHWRGRDVLAGHLTRKVLKVWSIIGRRKDLRLIPFDGGIEIIVNARNRGDAVRTVLAEMGPHAAVAYLGDDTTDEDAFGALHCRGLNILVREQYRKTLADVWIRPPDEVVSFLISWIAACSSIA